MNNSVSNKGISIIAVVFCLLLLSIFISAFRSAIIYTSKPSFCGSCHLMQTRYISFKRSVHNDATCLSCHTSPGIIGEMKGHINGIKYLYYSYMGYRTTQILHATVQNESCMSCHDIGDMDKSMEYKTNLVQNISHKSHSKDLDVSCTSCHGNIMHIKLIGTAEKTTIKSCRNCHIQSDFIAQTDTDSQL
jgi:cytochrome c nitrite reductase small subunit